MALEKKSSGEEKLHAAKIIKRENEAKKRNQRD